MSSGICSEGKGLIVRVQSRDLPRCVYYVHKTFFRVGAFGNVHTCRTCYSMTKQGPPSWCSCLRKHEHQSGAGRGKNKKKTLLGVPGVQQMAEGAAAHHGARGSYNIFFLLHGSLSTRDERIMDERQYNMSGLKANYFQHILGGKRLD